MALSILSTVSCFDLVLGFGFGGTTGLLKKCSSAAFVVSTNLGLGVGRGFRSGFGGARGFGVGCFLSVLVLEIFRILSRSSSQLKTDDILCY